MSCRGRRLKHPIMKFVAVWAALLVSVRRSDANAGALVGGKTSCPVWNFCITLLDEIRASAGLCVVIPCSFTTDYNFYPEHLVWYKCDQSKERCGDTDVIFHTNPSNTKVQPGYKGRVSLLESDLRYRNCSIIINDLTESDSGWYQLRVIGVFNGRSDRFLYPPRTAVYVGDVTQKPTVEVPPLIEGHEVELTCTAPRLCSGSDPEFTWIWSRGGKNVSHIPGSMKQKQEAQRHRSVLTFNPSAEHHGTSVTCRVGFANNISTEVTVTLNVTYVKMVKIAGNTTVKEGDTLSLTCSLDSFPPSLVSWTKFPNSVLVNDADLNLQNNTNFYLQRETGKETLTISNMTPEDSGQYICSAKYLDQSQMETVDVRVIYIRNPLITGETTVREGHTLNLTCSVKSSPPSRIMWTRLGSSSNLLNDDGDLQNHTGSATLVVHNTTREDSAQYVCTAEHQDKTVTLSADVTVTWLSKILDTSGCRVQSQVLTCECISEGVPLPTISWPVLRTHAAYSVLTTVSNHTVNSTVTLSVKEPNPSGLECVGSNEFGEVKQNLNVQTSEPAPDGQIGDILSKVSWLEVIIAFLIGALLSAVICSLVVKVCRKKQNSSRNLDGTVEMMFSQEDPLIDAGQAWDNHTYHHDAAEEGEVAVESEKPETNGDENKVVYARIDFSKLKRRSPTEAAEERQPTETEYAEIKKAKEDQEENGKEEGEVLEINEENVRIGEDEETNLVPEESEVEEMAVYSNVKEIMDGN